MSQTSRLFYLFKKIDKNRCFFINLPLILRYF